MHHTQRIRPWLIGALLTAAMGGGAWAQAPAPAATPVLVYPDELLPTRFVLCQREVSEAKGDRKRLLRTCLSRRLEGERMVERSCRRQVGSVSGTAARQQAQRDCERQALAVPSNELPRRPPPPPRPAPAAGSTAAAAPSLSTPPSERRPAAGEQ